ATRLRSGNRVPRPRNAFMIFRSEFWAGDKISSSVERDHRHISRIIGHCWNQLSETEKDVWRRKAEQEKVEHSLRYPGYRFSPTTRKKKPVKRKVKRNGKEELLRCKQVAALILSGKEGEELDTAVKCLNIPETHSETDVCNKEEAKKPPVLAPVSNVVQSEPRLEYWNVSPNQEAPAFRSPLLPP
ncbi:high mobility group box domain-containing protein, partial [Collybia nuda]